ncbi:MAG: DUF2919 family protein [Glaciecola sp.]|nr:DUF2919 family protein [Glaciecola sp.]MDG1815924.1 DUF2919 family protein [Glaciecola sp.]MDG2100142.1 DUF2919 family protein [Glaciecola sp.]
MTRLPLHLHCYDDAGRIVPPRPFWWSLVFLAKSWLILIGSVTIRGKESEILAFWYPHKFDLYLALGLGLPAVIAMLLCSNRERLWLREYKRWVYVLIACLALACFGQLTHYGLRLINTHFVYDHATAMGLVGVFGVIGYTLRSRYLRLMYRDWMA